MVNIFTALSIISFLVALVSAFQIQNQGNTLIHGSDNTTSIYGYHFHFYFLPNDEYALHSAQGIYHKALELWGDRVKAINIFEKPVGPHPYPMVQICLEDKDKDTNMKLFVEVLPWVQMNVDLVEHPLLLHPLTTPYSKEEELKDHTVRALWIGQKLKINERRL